MAYWDHKSYKQRFNNAQIFHCTITLLTFHIYTSFPILKCSHMTPKLHIGPINMLLNTKLKVEKSSFTTYLVLNLIRLNKYGCCLSLQILVITIYIYWFRRQTFKISVYKLLITGNFQIIVHSGPCVGLFGEIP